MIAILPQKPLNFYAGEPELAPHSTEAEEAILGGILIDPGAMARVTEILEPHYFLYTNHQRIFRAFLELQAQNKPIDLMATTLWLAENKLLEQVGGQARLAMLAERTVSAVNIDQLALLVHDKFVHRAAISFGNDVLTFGQQNFPIDDLIDRIKSGVETLDELRVKRDGTVTSESEIRFKALCKELDKIEANENPAYQDWKMKELAKEWNFRSTKELLDFHAKFLDSRHRKGEKLTYGLTEYFEKFAESSTDWLIRGWIPNKVVTVLHAAGGVGKTRLVSSICRALIAGKSWSGYDVESPTCVLFIETDQGSVVNIKMFDEQGYLDESEEVRSRLRINDDWNINQYGRLKAMLNAFRESHPDSKILVVVDSLTTVSSNARFSENDQEFARPLVRFRAIAEEMNCSFLVLHHSNRSGECRGTTAIFNAADQVFKLERSDPKNAAGPLVLDIQKTRNRAPGRYSLQYDENTWTWEIVGRVEADGSIEDNYGTTKKLILDFVKAHQGVGFEAEEFAHFLGLNSHTCRRELLSLQNEGLINSIRRGRARKIYFVGQLIEPNSSRSIPLQPIESDRIDQSDQSDRIDRIDRIDQSDQKTNLEKKQKSGDQYDQYDQYAPRAGSELITTSDHSDQFSKPNCQEAHSLVNDAAKDAVTVDVPAAIANTKSLEVGDKIISPKGTELVKVCDINGIWIDLKLVEAPKLMIQKGTPKARWLNDDVFVISHKELKNWVDVMSLRVAKTQAIAEADNSPDAIASDEPDWQPGDKLLMSCTGTLRKYEVEFVSYKVELDGSYKAIVLDGGKQIEWEVSRLSRPEGGQS